MISMTLLLVEIARWLGNKLMILAVIIFNLHSWLTFQLRYLVIHGPCDFVVKGCRGLRAGEVTPQNPRMQDQCATLGFTANLE